MRLAALAILTVLLAMPAQADELTDMLNRQVARYVAANPAPARKLEKPADVVRAWRDMSMVATMIQLHEEKALPADMRTQIPRRLGAALASLRTAVGSDDRQLALLADITLLYAKAAADYGRGRASYSTVADARALLTGTGATDLARRMEKQYATAGSIIPPEAPPQKW